MHDIEAISIDLIADQLRRTAMITRILNNMNSNAKYHLFLIFV